MDSVQKAIWFIENNYRSDISLTVVADAVSLSKFHMVRAFGLCTGHSVNGYIRLRRLSEAAKDLAGGSASVLDTAFSVGYGSHEAFTRAFRQHFGMTPDQLRKARTLETLDLVEPIKMKEEPYSELSDPTFVTGEPLLIVGLKHRYNDQTSAAIPSQWQEFAPHIGHMPHQKGDVAFGVCCNSDDEGNMDYIAGAEVTVMDDLPADLDGIRITPQTYAVFEHSGHISDIRRTWASIFATWLPASGKEIVDAPQFERYDDRFDPLTGNGVVEIWIPVQ